MKLNQVFCNINSLLFTIQRKHIDSLEPNKIVCYVRSLLFVEFPLYYHLHQMTKKYIYNACVVSTQIMNDMWKSDWKMLESLF